MLSSLTYRTREGTPLSVLTHRIIKRESTGTGGGEGWGDWWGGGGGRQSNVWTKEELTALRLDKVDTGRQQDGTRASREWSTAVVRVVILHGVRHCS